MEMDFALLLVIAVGLTGLGYAADLLFFRKQRQRAVSQYLSKGQRSALDADVIEKLEKEPLWAEYSRSFFPVLTLVLVLRSFLVEPFQIPSGSMLPTLKIGDFILVNKFAYGLRLPVTNTRFVEVDEPKRGDVMVFRYPVDTRLNFIKRVVGLPGDRISYENKVLYINGEPAPQQFVAALPAGKPEHKLLLESLGEVEHQIYNSLTTGQNMREVVVPEGHYFMMGDNRDHSNDSRFWGFVSEDLIVGKAFAVWMHWEGWSSLPQFSDTRLIK